MTTIGGSGRRPEHPKLDANWPVASCCGEPRLCPEVDACHDHAKVCPRCGEEPMAPGAVACPWCILRRPAEVGGTVIVRLPGLRCENCQRVAYDDGGGRACYSGVGGPSKRCGTMRPVWLLATVEGER